MLLILGALLLVSWIARATKAKWFPYPSAWLKALGLAVPSGIGAVIALSLLSWQFVFLFVLAVVDRLPIPNIFLVFAAGTFIASLVWYLLLVLLYSLFLRLLWQQIPKAFSWIKPPKNWGAVFFGWMILTLAAMVPALVLLPFTSYCFYSSDRFSEILRKLQYVEFTEEVTAKIFGIWYVLAAYLYHFKDLFEPRRLGRKA